MPTYDAKLGKHGQGVVAPEVGGAQVCRSVSSGTPARSPLLMIARHAQRDTHDLAARRNTTRSALGERQVRRLDSVQLRYQALETRLAVVEDRLQISRPGPASTATSIADPSVPRGYLMKDVDSFAGFAHAIHTYLAGVALADLHGRRLLYVPFRAAHGLE